MLTLNYSRLAGFKPTVNTRRFNRIQRLRKVRLAIDDAKRNFPPRLIRGFRNNPSVVAE